MVAQDIFVDGEVFLDRNEEQNRFQQTLHHIIPVEKPDVPTHVFLVQGESGVGKSKLLRRLRDIATTVPPFDTEIQTIFSDWETERHRVTALKVPREAIQAQTVFYHLHRMARDAGWGHHFTEYQSAIRFLNEVEGKIGELLEQAVWGDRFGALRFLDIDGAAALLRLRLSPGERGVKPLPIFLGDILRDGHASLHAARTQVEDWLTQQADLEPVEERMFRSPEESLGEAIGVGFTKVSRVKPLVMFLDSYEIISRIDPWLQVMLRTAGPRVLWVIAGEGDLASLYETPEAPVSGKAAPRKLTVMTLKDFNAAQVSGYIRSRAPDRLLTDEDAKAFYKATMGYPLAVQLAADLWASGVPLPDITEVGTENLIRKDVLTQMSQRLLVHCDDPEDRRALMMMTIQRRPEESVQTAVLRPEKGAFDFFQRIRFLKIRYTSVRANGGVCLHESVSESLRAYLLRQRIRVSDEVKALTTRATAAIKKQRDQLESSLPRLEDRFENDEWREIMLDSVHWMFWHNEFTAWRQFNRDFVDALGYDRNLAFSLYKVVARLESLLSRDGRQRWLTIQAGLLSLLADLVKGSFQAAGADLEAEGAMYGELDRWHTRYGGKDYFAAERRAILDLRIGELYSRREKFEEALNFYLRTEKNMPARGEALRLQLARAFEELGDRLAWRREGLEVIEALPSTEAETSLKMALNLGRRSANTYSSLGAVQVKLLKGEAALENLLQAVTLNPGNKSAWDTLGNVYLEHDQYEKAIPAFRRAIELDPMLIMAHLLLAFCLKQLKREEDYRAHLMRLNTKIAEQNAYLRACYEALQGNSDAALAFLKIALQEGLATQERARQNPLFESIRNTQAFQGLTAL